MIIWVLILGASLHINGKLSLMSDVVATFTTEKECLEIKAAADTEAKKDGFKINPQIASYGTACIPVKLDTIPPVPGKKES